MTYQLEPIGILRTPFSDKYAAPRQPGLEGIRSESRVILNPDSRLLAGLKDLDGFSHLWLITWFDRVSGWKPLVLPPRGTSSKKGVFATRSPHRPNPIGLSLVRLIAVTKNELLIGDCDLLDGTPVLDIKPYLPFVESVPDAKSGWIGEKVVRGEVAPEFTLEFFEGAREKLDWLEAAGLAGLREKIIQVLSSDPGPHPYKRIKPAGPDHFILAWKDWRVLFTVAQKTVRVETITTGYHQSTAMPELHQRFMERFSA